MVLIFLSLFLILFQCTFAKLFVFGGSTRISHLSNWLNSDYPCQGDNVFFEENKKTVAFLDESLQISSIMLPQVGSIIFSDDSVLGEKSRWQCTKRKSPENVFYQPDTVFSGFSDPASWLLDEQPLLHMNQVPGANDDVMFTDMGAFQIFIDDQVTVNSLKISRDWSMTTHSFTHFVRTIEGQYQVELGHLLAKESSEGNISRMMPIKDPIIIRNRTNVGIYNPNIENKTLSLICKYVQCHPVTEDCSTTVRPLGHCCDICGSVMTFASNKFTVSSISKVIESVIKEENLSGLLQYSVERINKEDGDEVVPRYQIAGFPSKTYDDALFKIFNMKLHSKLSSSRANLMEYFGTDYQWSKLDHSYLLASKIAGFATFCLLILIAVTLSLKSNVFGYRNATSSIQVAWHQGYEDDDVVHLLNPMEDAPSDEEEDIPASLPIREESKPTVLQPDKHNLNVGASGLELQLIQ